MTNFFDTEDTRLLFLLMDDIQDLCKQYSEYNEHYSFYDILGMIKHIVDALEDY